MTVMRSGNRSSFKGTARLASLGIVGTVAAVLLAACGGSTTATTSSAAAPAPSAAVATEAAPSVEAAPTTITLQIPPVLTSQEVLSVEVPIAPDGTQLGFVVPILAEPGETSMAAGTTYASKLMGVNTDVVDANLDLSKQLQLSEDFLARGYNGVMGIELFPATLDAFYSKADAKGVANVTVFSSRPASLQEDATMPGIETAKMISAKFPDGATGVMLSDTPAPVIINRELGFEAMADTSKCKGCALDGVELPNDSTSKIQVLELQRNLAESLDGARKMAEDLIQKHPDIQFIWASNDVGGLGAAAAVKAAKKDIMVFGMNGDPAAVAAVAAGAMTATFDANQNKMGMLLVAQTLKWVASGTAPENILLQFTTITKDNAAEYIPWGDRAAWPQS
jgi:ABC-type sugar transport system substrate-binding protein